MKIKYGIQFFIRNNAQSNINDKTVELLYNTILIFANIDIFHRATIEQVIIGIQNINSYVLIIYTNENFLI